jgi:GTPase Era involved in 16S rRNA processing
MTAPVFVVVGNVNRGKSSIVSTLAAKDSVPIAATPHTTKHRHAYPMQVGGQSLYTLIDTPGFERPRQVLAWLREHETSTAERREVLQEFLRQHKDGDTFQQECELLQPILDGAAILYVVDGSKPPSPNYEAEMEILRWTAQPRVALINSTSDADYNAEWQRLLDQYFNMVRPFNAHQADFEQRIRLLQMLREMSEQTRQPLDEAIRALVEDRRLCLQDAAGAIAEMIADMLTLVVEKRLSAEADAERHRDALAADYYDRLRRLESKGWKRLKQIFLHDRLEVEQPALVPVDDDLFNVKDWMRLGLTRGDLVTAGAAAGAVTGSAIDLALTAGTFFAGMAIGGIAGGVGSWLAAGKLPKVKIKGFALGGKLLQIGPMKNPQFPWIALDRALLLLDVVARRAHARREAVNIVHDQPQGIVATLPKETRKKIEGVLAKLRRRPSPQAVELLTETLTEELVEFVRERYDIEEHGA